MVVAPGEDIQLVELGPGRGTLMDDVLRVCHLLPCLQYSGEHLYLQTLLQLPHTRNVKKTVHLIETSSSLREVQAKKLDPWLNALGASIQWHNSIDDISINNQAYTMFIAHEFFDALPFHLIEVIRSVPPCLT